MSKEKLQNKAGIKPASCKTGVRISYGLIDITAKSDAFLSAEHIREETNLSQLHENRVLPKYAILEGGGIPLDGSYAFFPEQSDPDAFFGMFSQNLSDENGLFSQSPALYIAFQNPHSSAGITLSFAAETNDFCSRCVAIWLDQSGEMLAEEEFMLEKETAFLEKQVENYYAICILFLQTNKPAHYLKLCGMEYGVIKSLDEENGDALIAAEITEQIDIAGSSAPIGKLSFSFHSADGTFDLLNLSGMHRLFQQKQWVKAQKIINGKAEDMGIFYLETPETENGITEMYCTDILGILDKTEYAGGMWEAGISAADLISEIMDSAGEAEQFAVAENLAEKKLFGYLPKCTHREALKKVCFALSAVLQVKRDGKIHFSPMETNPKKEIMPYDKVASHRIRQEELVTGAEIYIEKYTSADAFETIFSETLSAGEHRIYFSGPSNVSSVSGASLLRHGINYADVLVAIEGVVSISGKTYHKVKTLSGKKYAENLPANAKENIISASCTLYGDASEMALALYLAASYRLIDSGRIFEIGVCPGDAVSVFQENGQKLCGIITELTTDLTGGLIAKMEVAGNAETGG